MVTFYEEDLKFFRDYQDKKYFIPYENENRINFVLGAIMPNLGNLITNEKYPNLSEIFDNTLNKLMYLHKNKVYHGDTKIF